MYNLNFTPTSNILTHFARRVRKWIAVFHCLSRRMLQKKEASVAKFNCLLLLSVMYRNLIEFSFCELSILST